MSNFKIPYLVIAFGVLLCVVSAALKIQQLGVQSALPFLLGMILVASGVVMIVYRLLSNYRRS